MIVEVSGVPVEARTGGYELDGSAATVVLVHGAGMDGSVWHLQTRHLAHQGLRAMAVDLPGHGASGGSALQSIGEMAVWLERFADAVAAPSVHVVGHSMGTFVALEMASASPGRVASLTLCGTATSMPVHPDLLAAAEHDVPAAAALMASWGHGHGAQLGAHPAPGMWMLGGARALVERSRQGVLAADFRACMAYERASEAAGAVRCPATIVVGLSDKMTPAAGGRAVAAALQEVTVIELPGIGHSMMSEHPAAVRRAIADTVLAAS